MNEREVIKAFTTHLGRQKACLNLQVDSWPEDENRQSPEIDAIAGPFAIEHTSIDSVADQRRADDWYLRVVRDLDPVIADCVDVGFTITLKFDALKIGMDWNCVRADLKRWIRKNASRLSHGRHRITLPTSTPVDSPILMSVWKGQPRIIGFSRFPPCENSLATRIKRLLDRKATKLMRYRTPDSTTILLIEGDDIALMNELKMLDAIREAYPDGLPQGVDEIWFADTSIPDKPRYRDFTTEIVNDCHRASPSQ